MDNLNENEKIENKENQTSRNSFVLLTIAIFLGYLIFGLSENVKGPAIPQMMTDLNIDEIQIGFLLAINALGFLIACSFAAQLARKIGLRTTLILSLVVIALSGIVICYAPSYFVLCLAFFIMYLANGMLEITLGIIAATFFVKRTGTMLNLAHFFYGIGSAIGPVVAAGLMAMTINNSELGWRYMYLICMALALVPLIPALLGRLGGRADKQSKGEYRNHLKQPAAWCIIIILAFGGFAEMAIGGWLVNYLEKANALTTASAAFILTAFFIVFTFARLVVGPFIDKFGAVLSLLVFCAFAAITLCIGIMMGESGHVLIIICGFGTAPIYPTVFVVVAKLYRETIDSAMTVTLTAMGIVSLPFNLFIGIIVDEAKKIFEPIHGPVEGLGMAYTAGMYFIVLCFVIAFIATLILFSIQRKKKNLV